MRSATSPASDHTVDARFLRAPTAAGRGERLAAPEPGEAEGGAASPEEPDPSFPAGPLGGPARERAAPINDRSRL